MALDDYKKTLWAPTMPITEDRMNKLEEGVYVNREALQSLNSTASANATSISNIQSSIGQNSVSVYNDKTLWGSIATLYNTISAATSDSTAGANAWAQIVDLIGRDTLGNLNSSLSDYLTNTYTNEDASIRKALGTVLDKNGQETYVYKGEDPGKHTVYEDIKFINDALGYDAGGTPVFGNKDSENNIVTVLGTMNKLSTNIKAVLTALREAAPEPVYTSLANRLDIIDQRIENAAGALESARHSTANSTEYGSLDVRLEAIESEIINTQTAAEESKTELKTAISKKINIDDIENNLGTLDSTKDHVLDARQGRVLKELLYSTTDTAFTNSDTVASRISGVNDRVNTLNTQLGKNNYGDGNTITDDINSRVKKSNIYNDLDYETEEPNITEHKVLDAIQGKVLKDLIDSTNTAYKKADTALGNRLAAIETEISDARPQVGTDEESGEPIYGTLDNRLDSIESTATQIRNDINTIAGELAMVDETTNSIKDTNTKIDIITGEINAAHRTVEEGEPADTLNARFTDIDAKISHPAENEDAGGLTERLTSLEDEVKHESTGLAATKAIADANKTAIGDDNSGLTQRIKNLEREPKSATVVIDNEHITYTNGIPTLEETPVESKDYLLQGKAPDTKYYYWKYLGIAPNGTWELISGGGSSGTSSAAFAATVEEITNPDVNTDYYVGNNTDGYLHYRYIENGDNGTVVPILIGVDPKKIKTYNMIKTTGGTETEPINYLDFYEFNYGESNIITEELPPVEQRIARIVLPQGGGGGSSSVSNTKLVRIAPTSITTIFNGQGIFLRFFYSCVDNSGESHEGVFSLRDSNNVELLSNQKINSGSATESVNGWPTTIVNGETVYRPDGVIYDDGYASINVESYCRLGINTFTLVMTTGTKETLYRQYTVDIKELRLESTAPETLITNLNTTAELPYTPLGALEKDLHIFIDNVETDVVHLSATNTGNELTYIIPAQTQGHHKIKFYLSTEINGKPRETDPIIRDYIWRDNTAENVTILASSYRDETKKVTQYDEVEIPYTVYSSEPSVLVEYFYDYKSNQENIPFSSALLQNTNNGLLRYNANDAGNHSLTIKANNELITIYLNVESLSIDIAPVSGAIIDFNPALLTNTSVGREPEWTVNKGQTNEKTYKLTVSDNFNWSTNAEDSGGGYREDADGKCFVIRAGDYATLNYKMFTQNNVVTNGIPTTTSKVFDQGVEMKIIFKVSAVRDASATWFTNMGKYVSTSDKEVGIQLNAHNGWLKTDKATDQTTKVTEEDIIEQGYALWEANHTYSPGDIVVVKKKTIYECVKETTNSVFDDDEEKKWRKIGQLETEVGATNSYLYFPYSEDDKIELDININKTGNSEDFIMSYEDGVPSKAYPYDYAAGGDILYQIIGQESDIRIGSPDCDVYIYRIKIYDNGLQTNQILKNFIADGQNVEERKNRYNRNSIYYDSTTGQFTPYASASAILDPIQLSKQIPDVKILMLETPRFTTGKKDFVRGTLRCIQAQGGKVYPATDADNWFFFNGYHAGQGTTSDNYGQSGRNVDFLFECDGTHYPTKKKNMTDFEKGYKSAVIHGNEGTVYRDLRDTTKPEENKIIRGQWEPAPGAELDECTDWMNDSCKVSLTHFNKSTLTPVDEDTSIPNNYFNLKVNIASSENVNNALFQKRYTDFLPYTSPAKQRDSRTQNGMEFVPAILFIRETGEVNTHSEFADNNWHFYALGNIGDSKKSDYTRAYDPTDMNEFTIEISDNNTANSQFQSGVYKNATTNNVETIETSATETDPMDYVYPISSEQWNAKNDNDEYINYRHKTLSTEGFDGDHSFEFRYACCGDYRDGDLINDTHGDSDIPNPDPEEVNDKPFLTKDDVQFNLNRAVWEAFYEWVVTADITQFRNEASLWIVPEAMEFFYAYTHYYTMMDNRAKNTFWHFAKVTTGDPRPVPIGRAVPALFHIYEIADANAPGGYKKACEVENAVFDNNTQYYTRYAFDLWIYDTDTACGIDNNGELVFPYGKEDLDYRVAGDPQSGWAFNGSGSIFWRRLSTSFADGITTIMRQSPVECFSNAQHLIEQFDKFQECYPEEIWRLDIQRKYIRTFTGKSYDNSITTGKQNIRFLKAMMQGRKKYQRRQWVRDQSIYFGSKYFLNNVGTDAHTIEFNTYTPSIAEGATLAVPVDREHVVVKPYQDMYINVAVGNSTTNIADRIIEEQYAKRAKAGESVIIDCRSGGSAQETRVYIYGAEHIAAIENLAPAYTYSGSFGQGVRLKSLDLGSDNPNYNNPRFTSISVNARMPILESFSVKNCNALGGTINLSQSNNLKFFEAEGSAITGVSLPNYTHIQQLHLPSTVTSLNLSSAHYLTDFFIHNSQREEDYSSLINLNIDDSDYSSNINWMTVAIGALNGSLDTLYLQRLSHSSIGDISELEPFAVRKKQAEINYDTSGNLIQKIIFSGLLNVTGKWSQVEKDNYSGKSTSIWPNLTLNTLEDNKISKTKVVYMNRGYWKNDEWVEESEITTKYVGEDEIIPDLYTGVSVDKLPHRDSTIAFEYQFGSVVQNTYTTYSGWTLDRNGADPVSLYNNGEGYTANRPYRAIASMTEVILYTLFNEAPHLYTVNWYLDENKLVKNIKNQEYGGGYTLEAPTVKDIRALYPNDTAKVTFNSNDTATIKIFDGWEKLPTNINPTLEDANSGNYNIYAKWYEKTVSLSDNDPTSLFYDTSNLTLEQLFVLSRMSSTYRNTYSNSKNIKMNKKFSYQMGYDSSIEGTTIVNTNQIQQFTENNSGVGINFSNIKPFTNNNGFTIAIDYQFDSTQEISVDAAVLVGCYARNNGNITGFALYNNANSNYGTIGATVGYGNMFSNEGHSKPIGNLSQRNIIVLRHPANSAELWIYSSKRNASSTLDATITAQRIELDSQSLSSDATLCLGHLRDDLITSSIYSSEEGMNIMGAQGTIYWAKYWNEDLGAGECKQIATWPHENMTMNIAAISSDSTNTANARPSLYLTGLTTTSHGIIQSSRFANSDGTVAGWENSISKTICDNKIYNGLPVYLQAILSNIQIGYYNYTTVYDTNIESVANQLSSLKNSIGYVYVPSISSLDGAKSGTGTGNNNYGLESIYERNGRTNGNLITDITPYGWLGDNASMIIYDYSFGEENPWIESDSINSNYYNLRFPNKPILWSVESPIHIYRISRSAVGNTNLRRIIPNLQVGDIVVLTNEAAYMYVSTADIQSGIQTEPQGSVNSLFNTTLNNVSEGGWVRSQAYITRSVTAASGSYNNFIYINALGTTEEPTSSQNQPGLLSLDYAFTI